MDVDTRFRPVEGERIGTTAFFRNPPFLKTLVGLLRDVDRPRVLFHGCSNGAEPYSFAVVWTESGAGPIEIHATDVEPAFLKQAHSLSHPRLSASARAMVSFLAPSSVVSFQPSKPYDAVVCMNVLCYLSEAEQGAALSAMATYCDSLLCITAANPDVVRQELDRAGFAPVWENWLRIYYGWSDRLSWRHRKVWKLPYVPMLRRNWRYGGTSIFKRVGKIA
jgi:chemotaxis methyl-accepting protein methylase